MVNVTELDEKGFVWVKDHEGHIWACHINDLRDSKNISEEDLKKYCVDESTMGVNIGD